MRQVVGPAGRSAVESVAARSPCTVPATGRSREDRAGAAPASWPNAGSSVHGRRQEDTIAESPGLHPFGWRAVFLVDHEPRSMLASVRRSRDSQHASFPAAGAPPRSHRLRRPADGHRRRHRHGGAVVVAGGPGGSRRGAPCRAGGGGGVDRGDRGHGDPGWPGCSRRRPRPCAAGWSAVGWPALGVAPPGTAAPMRSTPGKTKARASTRPIRGSERRRGVRSRGRVTPTRSWGGTGPA